MSSRGNSSDPPTKSSSSRRIEPKVPQNQPPQGSLYTRLENAKQDATSILRDISSWPQDSAITVKGLMETISSTPDLTDLPLGTASNAGRLRDSIEQVTLIMEDVCVRLKKTHRKYGPNREFSDRIKYPFATLSKDGCGTALRGCHNDIDKALAALGDRLADELVTQRRLSGRVSESPAAQANSQNHPTTADSAITPVPQPSGNPLTSTHGKNVSTPQRSPSQAATSLSHDTHPEETAARRRDRLEVARITFETIQTISGTIPVVGSYIGAGSKVGLTVVQMIQTMDSNTEAAKDLESRTGRLSDLLGHFKKRSTECPREEFLQQITKLQSELQSMRNKINELNSQGTLRNVLTSSGQAEALKGYQETIRVALEELQLLASLNTANLLNELYDTEIRKEQRRLLDRLGDAGYGARGSAIEEVICLPGTRVEVLERIDDWIRDATPSDRVLWIRGMAGRGKSTLATTVAYNWRYRAAFAIFHFRRGQNALDQRIVCSLARQLGSSAMPGVKEAILQSIRENEDIGHERLQEQFKLLFVASAERLRQTAHPIVVVVDALDECEDTKYAVDFVNLIHQHASSFPTNFKFLLTTRPETPLLEALTPRQWRTEDLDIATTIDQDIEELLQRRFSVIRERRGLGDDWPTQDDIRLLVQMSQGLFQWAQTAMEYISEGSPELRLEELLESPSLCDGLDKLYVQILSKAYEKAKKRQGRAELLLRLLGTLAAAAYPVSLDIFTYLAADKAMFRNKTQQQTIQLLRLEILCDLGSLVYLPDSSNQPMRLVHTSVRDLLVDQQRCGGEPYFIDLGQNHRTLTVHCLSLMARNLRENICKLSDLSKSNAEVQEIVDRDVPKGLEYCCRSWSVHLIAGRWFTETPETLFELAWSDFKSLSERKILCWLEVMSLVGATIDAMTMAKKVQAWLKGNPNTKVDSELVTIWDDAHRFIASFLEPISFGALHIYASALPFCPTNTKLWKYYSSHAFNRVLHGPQDLVWSPYLWARSTGAAVRVVMFLHDGKVLASGGADHKIRLWDCETGTQLGEPLTGHSSTVVSLAQSPDGKILASGSDKGTICLWNAETGDLLGQPLEGHPAMIWSLAFSPDGNTIAVVSDFLRLQFWDCKTGVSVGSPVVSHLPRLVCAAISPDAKVLALTVRGDSGAIHLLDTVTGRPLVEPLRGHSRNVGYLAFTPDGKILASGSYDGTIRFWELKTGAPIRFPLRVDDSPISVLAFSPNGDILASGYGNQTIQFWDVRTGTKCGAYQTHHTSSIKSLSFSPNGKILASGSTDETVKLWDVQGTVPVTDLGGHRPDDCRTFAIAFSFDGKVLASGGDDKTIHLWDAETGTLLNSLPACHSESISSLIFSPNGMILASASEDKTIRLWDTKTRKLLGAPLTGHTADVNVVAFSPDGKILASGSDDTTIRLWDASSRTPLGASRSCHDSPVYSLAFSPNGRLLASGCFDGTVRLWDTETGVPIASSQEDIADLPLSLDFISEGKLVAKDHSNAVVLYDILPFRRATAIPSTQSPFLALAPELTAHIFNFVDQRSCSNAARSCKGLKDFALDQLWKEMPYLLPLFRLLDDLTYTVNGWNLSNGLANSDWDKFWSYAERVRAVTVIDRTGANVRSCHLNPQLFLHISAAMPTDKGVRLLLPKLTRLTFLCYHPYGTTILLPLISPTLRHLSVSLFKPSPQTNQVASTTFSTLTAMQSLSQLDSLEVIISNTGSIATEGGRQAQIALDRRLTELLESQSRLQSLRLTPLRLDSSLNQSFLHLSDLRSLVITCEFEPRHGSLTEGIASIASCTALERLLLRIGGDTSGHRFSFSDIRPLLACQRLALLDICHLEPLSLTNADVEEMGRAWNRMESLSLWSDDFPIHLLLSFAASFSPRLLFLGLPLNLEGIEFIESRSQLPPGVKFPGLTTLHIGDSWIKPYQLVAFTDLLGVICSPGVKVWSGERPYNLDGHKSDRAKQCREVNVLLEKVFRKKSLVDMSAGG